MTEDRDPMLTEYFAAGREDIQDDGFSQRVSAAVARYERFSALRRIGFDVAIVVLAWIIAEPAQALVYGLLPELTRSLVEVDNALLAQMLLPLNSLTGVLALGFLLGRSVYRRLFRRG